jgi:hypothetical protein
MEGQSSVTLIDRDKASPFPQEPVMIRGWQSFIDGERRVPVHGLTSSFDLPEYGRVVIVVDWEGSIVFAHGSAMGPECTWWAQS